MSVIGSPELAGTRRHHLAALAYEVEARGLRWRLAGPEGSVLAVVGPRTRRQLMVVATPTGGGWSYLWSGGGMADAARAADAADLLARLLGCTD
ncbi:hypothetical protein [Actinomadura parmotrematis]|uniref:Uncharacterized protein n=1 Tax=Actinomadura parmotrematis TaxID=2864039 RepID=A0ABS7FV04_9ACTN|nr:hypothetical protein [Actinomadura parmotrematis]MBW8484249.1 hypothetical protein [Actinomadura parmotrematis]